MERLAERRARDLPERSRLESRTVEVSPWGRMHFRASMGASRSGARPVVLVHGFVVSGVYMMPTAMGLAPHHPVLVPDLPGFGRSDRPGGVLGVPELAAALADFLDATTMRAPVVVASSFGCQVAVRLAVDRPDRVHRLVLLGPTLDPEARTVRAQALRWIGNSVHEPPLLSLVILRDYLAFGLTRAPRMLPPMLRDHIEDGLASVRAPTLVVRGRQDPIVPRAWADRMAETLPCGRVAELDGAPHTLNWDVPRDVVRVVRAFATEPDEALIGDAKR